LFSVAVTLVSNGVIMSSVGALTGVAEPVVATASVYVAIAGLAVTVMMTVTGVSAARSPVVASVVIVSTSVEYVAVSVCPLHPLPLATVGALVSDTPAVPHVGVIVMMMSEPCVSTAASVKPIVSSDVTPESGLLISLVTLLTTDAVVIVKGVGHGVLAEPALDGVSMSPLIVVPEAGFARIGKLNEMGVPAGMSALPVVMVSTVDEYATVGVVVVENPARRVMTGEEAMPVPAAPYVGSVTVMVSPMRMSCESVKLMVQTVAAPETYESSVAVRLVKSGA
jgi:hypothetical protein